MNRDLNTQKKREVRIAIVEDDHRQRNLLVSILEEEGMKPETFETGTVFLRRAGERAFDIALLDYRLEDMTGADILDRITKQGQDTRVIIITSYGNVDMAVEVMKKGAFDFIRKPVTRDELLVRIDKALEHQGMNREILRLQEIAGNEDGLNGFIFKSRAMKQAVKLAGKVAISDANVLICGATGTGKERIAQMIHKRSPRSCFPLVKVNIAALPDTLVESELFGAEKGAFTGAVKRITGKFEAAARGTLFLDEITEFPLASQVKILRAIQEKEIFRLGSSTPVNVDVRVIAATNRDVEQLVKENKFRRDLYYRLNVIEIQLPSLSERKEDIPALTDYFIKKYGEREKKTVKGIRKEALKWLLRHDFPGNVRELENIIERGVVLGTGDYLEKEDVDIFSSLHEAPGPDKSEITTPGDFSRPLPEVIETLERTYMVEALKQTGGVKTRAAHLLGISERVLRYRMKQLGIVEYESG